MGLGHSCSRAAVRLAREDAGDDTRDDDRGNAAARRRIGKTRDGAKKGNASRWHGRGSPEGEKRRADLGCGLVDRLEQRRGRKSNVG